MQGDDVEPHDEQVVLLAGKVADVVPQQALGAEAEALERRDGALLVRRHAGDDLLDPGDDGRLERLLHEQPAQALAARSLGDDDADLGDVGGPLQLAAVDGRVADHLFVREGEQSRHLLRLDVADPLVDHLGVADVAAQKQEVVIRQAVGEREQGAAVARVHGAHRQVDDAQPARHPADGRHRLLTLVRHRLYTDRSASHSSSRGHRRRTAFRPATRLTWPPFSMSSCLSSAPTIGTRSRAAS